MDKKQKELIKSYYRARKGAIGMNVHSQNYVAYELNREAVENDLVNLNLISFYSASDEYFIKELMRDDIALLLNKMDYDRLRKIASVSNIINELYFHPEVIKNINWEKIRNNEIYPFDIAYIVAGLPQYFDDDFFMSLDGELVTQLLNKKPNLINKVDYNKMGVHDVARLLGKYPELIKYFKGFIPKMDDYDIMHMLADQPELLKYVKKYNKNYANLDV